MNGFMPGVLEVKSGLVRSGLAGVVLSVVAACLPVRSVAFDLDDVAAKAEQLCREPFQDPKGQVPEWLLKIDYDQWRDIRFRPARRLPSRTRCIGTATIRRVRRAVASSPPAAIGAWSPTPTASSWISRARRCARCQPTARRALSSPSPVVRWRGSSLINTW